MRFILTVAHASLHHAAAALAGLYRAKDTIERDFRVIKDVIELRPIYHYTERDGAPAEVRAHVTICMLALLL